MKKPELLTFEAFSQRHEIAPGIEIPRYDNLFVIFRKSYAAILDKSPESLPKARAYKRFRQEHPEHYDRLAKLIAEIDSEVTEERPFTECIKRADEALYEVYQILRSYGVSDKNIFS